MKMRFNKNKLYLVLPSLLTILILLAIFIYYGFAPFGNRSLATVDANIQYLDFYAYFKNVIQGKDSFIYSFNKGLGGNVIAVYSYYLSSPFVLLSLLFKQEDLYSYYNICVLLKLSLSAFTLAYYLYKRFNLNLNNNIHKIFLIVSSLGYSLGNYNIQQSNNIMWLDGVYLLPLIMLFIYELVNDKKYAFTKLAITIGLSILFNWYIAGVNCAFSGFWIIFELLLRNNENKFKNIKEIISILLRYLFAMVCGIMISAIIFLPTIYALKNSSRGQLESSLFSFSYTGNPLNYISNYVYGKTSNEYSACLFVGMSSIIGFICAFINDRKNKKLLIYILITVFLLLMFYWQPLYTIFSLFKGVGSYWYRYSYLGEFIILFISSNYYLSIKEDSNNNLPIFGSIIYIFLLGTSSYLLNENYLKLLIISSITCLIIGTIIKLFIHRKNLIIGYVLIVIVIFDMFYNAKIIINTNFVDDNNEYQTYVSNMNETIEDINRLDDSFYRILETSTRVDEGDNTTANYNEPLAYNYMSISSYTSSPDDNARVLLKNLGYIHMADNFNITNQVVLPSDALLGVKYIISAYDVNGLEKINNQAINGRFIYKNPYCLPLAFSYTGDDRKLDTSNPFEYVNSLYSKLLGKDINIFERIDYTLIQEGDEYTGKSKIFEIEVKDYENSIVYVNFPSNPNAYASININNMYVQKYSDWLAPSLVYIPMDSKIATIELSTNESYSYFSDSQFYKCNLDTLEEVINELKNNNIEIDIKNTKVKISIKDNNDENLLLTIPYEKGWNIKTNGDDAKYTLVGDCLYSIELDKGDNTIIMEYKLPYIKEGISISILGVLLTIFLSKYLYNKHSKR